MVSDMGILVRVATLSVLGQMPVGGMVYPRKISVGRTKFGLGGGKCEVALSEAFEAGPGVVDMERCRT